MEPSGSDSDGKVGNVSEHVSFCPVPLEFLVPFFGNSKEELGHDYRLPQDLVISWVLSGRTEYAGQKSNFQEDPVIKKESDLCHVRDWRPTGSALNLVRDNILHFFVMFLYSVLDLEFPKAFENVTCVLPEIGTWSPREGELGRPCETRCGICINSFGARSGVLYGFRLIYRHYSRA